MSAHAIVAASAQAARIGQPRFGTVVAVDAGNHAVRVAVQPEGTETGWLPDPGMSAGTLRISSPCSIGTHVVIGAIEGDTEQPVILGRLYDTNTRPPVSPYTGTVAQPGELLTLTGGNVWLHVLPSSYAAGIGDYVLTVDSTGVTFNLGSAGKIIANKDGFGISIGNTALTFTEAGGLTIIGAGMTTDHDVSLTNGVTLGTHIHKGSTAPPQPGV